MALFKKNTGEELLSSQQSLNSKQINLVGRSFLWAGVAFIILALLSFGLSYIWTNVAYLSADAYLGMFFAFLILEIIMIFMIYTWTAKTFQGKQTLGLTLTVYGIYILINAFLFSTIFAWIDFLWLASIFGIASLVFLFCGFIGWGLTTKGQLTLAKMFKYGMIILGILMLVYMITMLVGCFTWWYGYNAYYGWVSMIIGAVFVFIVILSIVSTFNKMKRASDFANFGTNEQQQKYLKSLSAYFGFELLTGFVTLLWYLIYFASFFIGIGRR